MILKNHLTVATIVERKNKFLCVWEKSENKLVFNQPAGMLSRAKMLSRLQLEKRLKKLGQLLKSRVSLVFTKVLQTAQALHITGLFLSEILSK